jgi:ABC-2 type transport system permease protein
VGLDIPPGFTADLARGRVPSLQIILDGSDANTASVVSAYVVGTLQKYAHQVTTEQQTRRLGRGTSVPSIENRTRIWYNPDLKSVNYMVPAVICLILLVTTTVLTSFAIVREREVGTLEQLMVTPIRPSELMLGKVLPFVLIGFIDVVLIVLVARFWFHIPLEGSLLLLFALTTIFLLTTLGTGLFISTICATQQQAMMTAFFFLMPSILLSGFMFPIENMPTAIQHLTYLLPMRYFLVIIRGIFLKGVGLAVLWPQVLALSVFAVLIITASAVRFQKRIG